MIAIFKDQNGKLRAMSLNLASSKQGLEIVYSLDDPRKSESLASLLERLK